MRVALAAAALALLAASAAAVPQPKCSWGLGTCNASPGERRAAAGSRSAAPPTQCCRPRRGSRRRRTAAAPGPPAPAHVRPARLPLTGATPPRRPPPKTRPAAAVLAALGADKPTGPLAESVLRAFALDAPCAVHKDAAACDGAAAHGCRWDADPEVRAAGGGSAGGWRRCPFAACTGSSVCISLRPAADQAPPSPPSRPVASCPTLQPNTPSCIVDPEWALKKMDGAVVLPGCAGSLAAAVAQCRAAKSQDKCAAAGACSWCVGGAGWGRG
jgi:hypothetical protein